MVEMLQGYLSLASTHLSGHVREREREDGGHTEADK